jgi:DNA-binding NarL/FixJ family response regulator
MVLVLTGNPELEVHARAVQQGAAGVLHKAVFVKDIVGAARRLVAGEPILSVNEVFELLRIAGRSQKLNHEVQRAIEELTPRERRYSGRSLTVCPIRRSPSALASASPRSVTTLPASLRS